MAVYTEVSDDELVAFVAEYDIGEVMSCKGIAEGVENTNYLLQTDRGFYILTLYEKRVNPAELPFFIGLMEHLAERGLACPTPIHGLDGQALRDAPQRLAGCDVDDHRCSKRDRRPIPALGSRERERRGEHRD